MTKIEITESAFMWSVTWTTDSGATWHTQAFDSRSAAMCLANRIGSMKVYNAAE